MTAPNALTRAAARREPLSGLGQRIRQRLDDLERGPAWLARRLNRHPTTVSAWLVGRHYPTIPQLREIAAVLDCSPGWLLGEAPSPAKGRSHP